MAFSRMVRNYEVATNCNSYNFFSSIYLLSLCTVTKLQQIAKGQPKLQQIAAKEIATNCNICIESCNRKYPSATNCKSQRSHFHITLSHNTHGNECTSQKFATNCKGLLVDHS